MPDGHAPGTDADKGPKKPIMEQLREKMAAKGHDISPDGAGANLMAGLDQENPFAPDLAAQGASAEAQAASTGAEGASSGANADTQTNGTQDQGGAGVAPTGDQTNASTEGQTQPAAAGAAPAAAAPAGAAVVSSATGAPVTGAAAATDEWADVEIEDPETARTFKVRVPKAEENAAKGGWMRRADYTRKTQYLSKYKPILEPMIASGEFEAVEPYLRLATTDAAFAQAMVALAQQRVSGQPLSYGAGVPETEIQRRVDAEMQRRSQAQPSAASATDANQMIARLSQQNPDLDPYTLQTIAAALPAFMAPLEQRLADVTGRLQQQDEQTTRAQQEAEQQRQRQYAQQQEVQRFSQEAAAAFRSAFPGEFTGSDADFQKLGGYWDYAQRAGLIAQHGALGGLFAAKRAIDAANAEYTGSAAAGAVAQRNALDDIEARNAAAAAANKVAQGMGGGAAGGAGAAGAMAEGAVVLKGADLRDPKTGKMLPTNQILRQFQTRNQHLTG